MKINRSKKYDCLGISLDYLTRDTFKVGVTNFIDPMKEDFPHGTNITLKT